MTHSEVSGGSMDSILRQRHEAIKEASDLGEDELSAPMERVTVHNRIRVRI